MLHTIKLVSFFTLGILIFSVFSLSAYAEDNVDDTLAPTQQSVSDTENNPVEKVENCIANEETGEQQCSKVLNNQEPKEELTDKMKEKLEQAKAFKDSIVDIPQPNNEDTSKVAIYKDFKDNTLYKAEVVENLGIVNPVFFLTEKTNSRNFRDTSEICNFVNVSGNPITCLTYAVDKVGDMEGFFRRGVHSDQYKETQIDGDFAIIRADILKQAQNGTGPLKNAPPLDVVAYLNGSYLFTFSDISRKSFSVEQLMMNYLSNKRAVVIGYFNTQSRNVFNSLVKPLFPKNSVTYRRISVDKAEENLCYDGSVDMYIYLGSEFPDDIKQIMGTCSSRVVPLTFSDNTLKTIISQNDMFAIANVVNYFDISSTLNFIEAYVTVEKALRERKQKEEQIMRERALARQAKIGKVADTVPEVKQSRSPVIADPSTTVVVRQGRSSKQENETSKVLEAQPKYDKDILIRETDLNKIAGKRGGVPKSLVGVFPGIKASITTEQTPKLYVTANTTVKTFGIRNVLVASRYTKKDNVTIVFDSLIKNYLSIKDRLLTQDMSGFSVSDIVLGTGSSNNPLSIHPAIFGYTKAMLSSKASKTPEQGIVIKLLANSLNQEELPASYGPIFPDKDQLNIIYKQVRELNRRKQELNAVRIFQRDVANVEEAINSIKQDKEIPDSILKSTGLDRIDIITITDNLSVSEGGIDYNKGSFTTDDAVSNMFKENDIQEEPVSNEEVDAIIDADVLPPSDDEVLKSDKSNSNAKVQEIPTQETTVAKEEVIATAP